MPQDFGIFFGDEFLGTSTPKQGIKHIINPKRFSGNVDFKDQVIVNQSLNSCTSELKCSYTKAEAKKPRAIGDSASNLNTSWFLPIDHVVSADWPRGLLRTDHVFRQLYAIYAFFNCSIPYQKYFFWYVKSIRWLWQTFACILILISILWRKYSKNTLMPHTN